MKKIPSSLLVIVAVLITGGCHRVEPIYNVANHPLPDHVKRMSEDEIGDVIARVLSRRKWQCNKIGHNTLLCHYYKRGHEATVEITYNRYEFSVDHLNSKNLRGTEDGIHRNYNKWVKIVERDIVEAMNQDPPQVTLIL